MKRFYTFEHVSRATQTTPDWCTLRFRGTPRAGSISILSRDKVRSTKRVWNVVGAYETLAGKRFVWLDENSFATRLAATCMARNWNAEVYFSNGKFNDDNTFRVVAILRSNGRVTKPSTIRNGGTQTRRTSLDLGLLPATGMRHGNSKGPHTHDGCCTLLDVE